MVNGSLDMYVLQVSILLLQRVLCDDYKKVTMHLQDETSDVNYDTTANITTLSDGRRRLVAYFFNLPENRQYQATSRVHYNQITLYSNKVQTSEMFSSNSSLLIVTRQIT